jgi:hypothetical protein
VLSLRSNAFPPEESRIDLLGSDEILKLFETGKRPVLKDHLGHVNPLE